MKTKILIVASLFLAGCGVHTSQQSGLAGKHPADTAYREPYVESFDKGCGGWLSGREYPLAVWNGVAYCHGPWFVDFWHAPPGAGYLHLIMWIHTDARRLKDYYPGYPGNKFIIQHQSTDFTNAKLTLRLRGEIDLKGSQMLVLLQATQDEKIRVNYVLESQPIKITSQWTEQTVTLTPDPDQWLCLGARHDRKSYGCSSIAEVLRDVNVDIIFVLFPLNVVPIEDISDEHKLRAGVDYHVEQKFLPKGLIMFDWVKLEYPD